jgi:DNA-binding NtrC family response regulator
MTETILIVGREPAQREIIRHVLEDRLSYRAATAAGGREAIDYMLSDGLPDLMLLDLSVQDTGGTEMIREALAAHPGLCVIVLTPYGDMERASAALRAGAADFLSRPVTVERLGASIRNALRAAALRREVCRLQRLQRGQLGFGDLKGVSPAFRTVIAQAKDAASQNVSLVLEGESGVGRLSLARAIHGSGPRRGKPFVAFDCQGLSELPSMPFPLREAADGTLFLREIGLLPPVLQERLVKECNGCPARIAASSRYPLDALAAQGRFRRDLLARIRRCHIAIPPLRERREDIPPLAEHFLKQQASQQAAAATGFSPAAMSLLVSHAWRGNVAQLQQAVLRAVLMASHETLEAGDFRHLPGTPPAAAAVPAAVGGRRESEKQQDMLPVLALVGGDGQMKRLEQIETELIRFAIRYYGGHMSEVARRLGIGRSTLYRKMQEMQVIGKMGDSGQAA